MARYIPDEVEAYAERYTSARGELFDRLAEETRATQSAPQMMVGHVEGAFLSFLVSMTRATRVVEVGTFTGWSSIAMADALPPGGSIVTCDVNEETSAVARRYAEEAGVADRIEYRLGPAVETLATLDGPFDLAFIDADKPNYANYFDALVPLMRTNGAILVDNVLWDGRVIDPAADDENTLAIKAFNDKVASDDRVDAVMLPISDGLTVCRVR